jgi:hypothetical protein
MTTFNPLFLCTLMLAAGTVTAQERLQPRSAAKVAEYKTLIVETIHPYAVREYSPPLVIATDVPKAAMAFDHPERTLAAYFSAMVRGSYADFLACWTADSAAQLEQVSKKLNRAPEQWEAIWASKFKGRRIEATHWINYGRYVLVNFRIEPALAGEPADEQPLVLKEESPGVWKLTQALRADAVPQHWKSPGNRVRLPADTLFDR